MASFLTRLKTVLQENFPEKKPRDNITRLSNKIEKLLNARFFQKRRLRKISNFSSDKLKELFANHVNVFDARRSYPLHTAARNKKTTPKLFAAIIKHKIPHHSDADFGITSQLFSKLFQKSISEIDFLEKDKFLKAEKIIREELAEELPNGKKIMAIKAPLKNHATYSLQSPKTLLPSSLGRQITT